MALPPSYRRQQLLLDFAALKTRCPEGFYLTPSPSNPSQWSGVFFVRDGPYASTCLRFDVLFPSIYPDALPLLTFSTEIFHPLLVPLTTYTFAAGTLDQPSTISASEVDRLPPGSFSLRHGFPEYFRSGRGRSSVRSSSVGSITSSEDERHEENTEGTSRDAGLPVISSSKPLILLVLEYVKSAFETEESLDSLPFETAGNASAWHAWRAHRGLPKLGPRPSSPASPRASKAPLSPARNPGDWNWEGVWEARVRSGIEESVSDALLFGSKNIRVATSGLDNIRFAKYDEEKLEEVQIDMLRAHGFDMGSAVSTG